MYSSIVALAANTPGADGTLFQWSWFIFNKYSTLFLKATWVTLYVSLIGTILGFILGFAVGIINTVQIHLIIKRNVQSTFPHRARSFASNYIFVRVCIIGT